MISSRSIRWRQLLREGILLALIIGGLGITAYHFGKTLVVGELDEELQWRRGGLSQRGQPGSLGASVPFEDVREILFICLAWGVTGAGFCVFVLALFGRGMLFSRSLRPVREITETARRVADGDLARRIDISKTEGEFEELAMILNGAFARMESAFTLQTRFIADAAHELRTPISVMLMHSQNGLSISENTEEQQEAFGACHRSAQRMRRLIDALLQLTRFQGQNGVIDSHPCDLAEIAHDAADLVGPLADARGMTLCLELAAAPIHGATDVLHQVLTNLLINATQYGRADGVIGLSTYTEGGRSFCAVSDDGEGIAPEHLPHLFNRFYRVDKARTTQQSRNGLGLAIAKAIVEAHGGTIQVTSIVGGGSTFTVAFTSAS